MWKTKWQILKKYKTNIFAKINNDKNEFNDLITAFDKKGKRAIILSTILAFGIFLGIAVTCICPPIGAVMIVFYPLGPEICFPGIIIAFIKTMDYCYKVNSFPKVYCDIIKEIKNKQNKNS